jgi:hypothetical protein
VIVLEQKLCLEEEEAVEGDAGCALDLIDHAFTSE